MVIDRSGSMQGEKLATAKRAALAAVERLDERDRVAIVIYDNRIDVLQPAAPATAELKDRARAALETVEARGTTALHEGWLSGCHAIAADGAEEGLALARCFLLTDGLANVGLTDPEQIATQAAGVRENAGVATSTFGIGADYDEGLLGPMAVAGGGQFHHLRTAQDIAATFLGELADLGAVVAGDVRLEVELPQGVAPDLVSQYWATPHAQGHAEHWVINIGDLLGGEERHVVVRFSLPAMGLLPGVTLRARAVWKGDTGTVAGEWQEVAFSYADDRDCDAEAHDPAVMHWVGLHHADRAQREATEASRRGNLGAARRTLSAVKDRIARYAGDDPDLRETLLRLDQVDLMVTHSPVDSLSAKELHYTALRRSRGQKDMRYSAPDPFDANPANRTRAAEVVRNYLLRSVPWAQQVPPGPALEELRDRYRGCLLWGAVGDALGRAVEGQDPAAIRARYGPAGLREYQPWRGWRGGPTGTITDDTQLTIEVARTLLVSGERFDSEDFARRLVDWLPQGRGVGMATRQAVDELMRGKPWWLSGLDIDSAGNGAAMRAAPVGLAHALARTPWPLRRDAVLSSFPTHTHPVGIGGAVVIAAAVAYCVREGLRGASALDPRGLLEFAAACIDGTEPGPTLERKPGGRAVRLRERILEVKGMLARPTDEEVFAYLWNGAFALESVPAALYCALRYPGEPRRAILTAVNAGYDADSVASMAGNIAGAWCGARRLQAEAPEWWEELEAREELIALADQLAELALRREGDDGSKHI